MVHEGYWEKILILRSRCAFVDNTYEILPPYAMYLMIVRIVLGCLLRPNSEPLSSDNQGLPYVLTIWVYVIHSCSKVLCLLIQGEC